MPLHGSTFDYLKPSDEQINQMALCRRAISVCADQLEDLVPNGPDKTYLLRRLREVGMWANVAITRDADGKPRE